MRRTGLFEKSEFGGVSPNLVLLGILLVLVASLMGASWTGNSRIEEQSRPDSMMPAVISPQISYQGVLSESGVPVNGTRDMIFRLYTDDTCSTQTGPDIVRSGVAVRDGLFAVTLDIIPSIFSGSAVWLGIEVEGTPIGCQEILAAPYALSVRPGARIIGEQSAWDGLHVENQSTIPGSYGLYASTSASEGCGIYARGVDSGPDLILGVNADTTTGDDGVLSSSPGYPSSDLVFLTNDGIRIELDNDANGEDADFEIRDKDDEIIFNVDESGAVSYGGAGLAAFPKPAYDSGWQSVGLGTTITLTHNLGGSVDNYIVDMTFKDPIDGVHNWGLGADQDAPDYYGAYWYNLTTTLIKVKRQSDDEDCPQIRIRIWMYS